MMHNAKIDERHLTLSLCLLGAGLMGAGCANSSHANGVDGGEAPATEDGSVPRNIDDGGLGLDVKSPDHLDENGCSLDGWCPSFLPWVGGSSTTATAIWGTGVNDIWVSSCCGPQGASGVMAHWDGAGWEASYVRNDWTRPGVDAYDLWGVSSDLVFGANAGVILNGFPGQPRPRILAWDGFQWSQSDLPVPPNSSGGYSIWGTGKNDIWVVGGLYTPSIGHYTGGDAWIQVPVPDALHLYHQHPLWCVHGTAPDDVWVVGSEGTILHWTGSAFTVAQNGGDNSGTITRVWAYDRTHVWAVGYGGMIMYYDGTSWSPQQSNTGADLLSIWGTSPNDIWAVGSGGAVFHYDGTEWLGQVVGSTSTMTGVWGSSSSDVWIIEQGRQIFHHVQRSNP